MMKSFKDAECDFTKMVDKYKAPSSSWFNTIESEIAPEGRELTRKILQGHIESRGTGDVGESIRTVAGDILSHKRKFTRKLQTQFGEVLIQRIGYSNRKHSNFFPLDAFLNLPDSSFSFGIQKLLVKNLSLSAFSEVLSLIYDMTGVRVGPRQASQIIHNCSQYFDEYYASKKYLNTNKLPILVLTTDGKGIVMRKESLREETKKKAENNSNKMQHRLSPGEKSNRKRMAQVASVYEIDRFIRSPIDIINNFNGKIVSSQRPKPQNKRIWASVERSSEFTINSVFDEAIKRDPENKKDWIILVDGNMHQLKLASKFSKEKQVNTTIILDIIHVIEYLWKAAHAILSELNPLEIESWVKDKILDILHNKASKVSSSIRMSIAKRRLSVSKNKTAEESANYISNHKDYMNYLDYLQKGFPIGTGVIDGVCRYLIKDRMDITGARWGLIGAEAVLKMRSLVKSDDFENYWSYYLQREYDKNYNQKVEISSLLSE